VTPKKRNMATKVITPEAQISYPHLFVPQTDDRGRKKFSAALVFAPGTDLTDLKAAVLEVLIERFGEKKATEMVAKKSVHLPFRDDAESKGYAPGSTFINVRGERQPSVVSVYPDPATGKPSVITDPAQVYAGCIVRASITAFWFDRDGKKGVSFGLNNVLKVRDGERLDGRVSGEDEFADLVVQPTVDLSDLTDESGNADTPSSSAAARLAAMLK
jgi:hypothetical protein